MRVLQGMLQLHNHRPPILHRDLKSPNLLVDKHWRVKVTDFNLSSMMHPTADSHDVNSSVANNPRWLAPEVLDMSCSCVSIRMQTWSHPKLPSTPTLKLLRPDKLMLMLNRNLLDIRICILVCRMPSMQISACNPQHGLVTIFHFARASVFAAVTGQYQSLLCDSWLVRDTLCCCP